MIFIVVTDVDEHNDKDAVENYYLWSGPLLSLKFVALPFWLTAFQN